jgi:hypothetical protein
MWCLVPALIQHHTAAELPGNRIMDNVQAKSGAALVAARRKEPVKRLSLHVRRHPAPVVSKSDLDIILAAEPGKLRWPRSAICKRMIGGIKE